MTHLACLLAIELLPWIEKGKLQLVCASSDGVDGSSGSAGAVLHQRLFQNHGASHWLPRFKRAVSTCNSAEVLEKLGALLPSRSTGTNVQDAVAIRVL